MRVHGQDMRALTGDGADRRPDGGIVCILRPGEVGGRRIVVLHGDVCRVKVRVRNPERHFKCAGIVEGVAQTALRIGVLHAGNRLGLVENERPGRKGVHLVVCKVERVHGQDVLALAGDGADRRPDGRIIRILRPDKAGDLRVVILHGDIRFVKVRIHDPERHLSRTGIAERIAGAALRIGVLRIGNRLGQVDDLQVGGSVHFVARCVPGLNGDVMGALAGERDRRGGGFPFGVDQPVDLEFLAVLHDPGKNIAVFLRQPLVIHQLEQNVGRCVAVVVAGLSSFPDCRGIFRGKRGRRFLQDDLVALLIFGAVARLVDGDEVQCALYLGLEGEFRRVDAGFFFVCDLRDLLARAADHAAVVIYKPVFEFLHTGGGILGGEGEFDACIVPAEGEEFQNCFAGDLADIVGEVGGRGLVDFDLAALDRVRDVAVHVAQVDILFGIGAVRRDGEQRLRPRRIAPQLIVGGGKLPALRGGNGDGAGVPAAVVLRFARHDIGRVRGLRVGNL